MPTTWPQRACRRTSDVKALLSALALLAGLALARAADAVFDGYEAWHLTLPARVFDLADQRPLSDGVAPSGRQRPHWRDGAHRLEIDGADLWIDGRRVRASAAIRFQGEGAGRFDADARLFVTADWLCLEQTAPTASGTAVRHRQVTLVAAPFGARPLRYALPSLFASCLALQRDDAGRVLFPHVRYDWPGPSPQPLGIVLEGQRIEGRRFVATGSVLRARFTEPGNVYRFTSPAP